MATVGSIKKTLQKDAATQQKDPNSLHTSAMAIPQRSQTQQFNQATKAKPDSNPQAPKMKVNPNRYANANVNLSKNKKHESFKKTEEATKQKPEPPKTTPDGREMGTANQDDMMTLFANSRLNTQFNAPHDGDSYFRRLEPGQVIYFNGTRRVIAGDGSFNEVSTCFLVRAVDKDRRVIMDRVIAIDFQSDMPFEQELNTYIGEDLQRAHTVDRNEGTDQIISRTFIKLRGEPWGWHSAIALTRLEEDEENFPDRPETMTISRLRFNGDSMLAEKLIRQNNETVVTIIDDLKIVTPKQFAEKTQKIYQEYSSRLQETLENAAAEYGVDEARRMAKMAGIDEDFTPGTRKK